MEYRGFSLHDMTGGQNLATAVCSMWCGEKRASLFHVALLALSSGFDFVLMVGLVLSLEWS
jgi:hypothetical protein